MTILDIAEIIHGALERMNAKLGEPYPNWIDMSTDDQQLFTRGIWRVLTHPDVTPQQQHDFWWMDRLAKGWTPGPKDYEKKTHPCMVPFDALPAEQQAKDNLFIMMVRALSPILTMP